MKKILLNLLLLVVSVYSFSQTEYVLTVKDSGASCFDYTVVPNNSGNADFKLPDQIQKALKCPNSVGLKKNFLTYVDGLKVKIYNLTTKTDHTLFTLYDDIDGFSSPLWSKDGKAIMFVIVNQERKHNYGDMCRIIYIKLKESGEIDIKRKFDRPVNFECGNICTAEPGKDFYFNEAGNIGYKVHWNRSDNKESYEVIEL